MLDAPFLLPLPPVPAPQAAHCPPAGQARVAASPSAPLPWAPRPGEGRLTVAPVAGESAVLACASSSPLRLLAPRARGKAAWVVAASHGGGLVAGDVVALTVEILAGAAACLGTQAETKVYRAADGRGARQELDAVVGAGGLLALLPDPVSPYAGARYEQVQRVRLQPGASLLLLDAFTAGRAARGERWAFARYRSRNEVRAGNTLLLADAVRLDAGEGPPLCERLEGMELVATVVAVGPAVAAGARAILEAVSRAPAAPGAPVLSAASPLADGVLLRLAARSVEEGMTALRAHLSFAAGPLDGDPLLRRP